MGYHNTRVIIASRDYSFFSAVEKDLQDKETIETVVNAVDLLSAEHKINRVKSNVMVLDLDTCAATTAYLRQLIEKYNLLIVLTATSPMTANNYIAGNIKEFIIKPRVLSIVYVSMFTSALLTRASKFESSTPVMNYHSMQRTVDTNQKILAIASSTGGTDALERILKAMPANIPPTLIVQHMPSGFTKFFANRLNSICPMEVREAEDSDYLQRGLVLIAPADNHMKLVRRNSKLMVECFVGTKIHGVMPAADVLFESIAPLMRGNVVGVILTGMGADGAKGLNIMHMHGAKTLGQNKESCVVYGMPKVAFDLGALDMQVHLDKMAETIMSFFPS